MKLSKITIENYRKFINEEMNFENDVTLIAGPNNSGKTSLITLVHNVMSSATKNMHFFDYPLAKQKELITTIKSKITEFNEGRLDAQSFEKEFMLIEELDSNLKIELKYEDDEDISLFSDYIMDLTITNKSVFFMHTSRVEISMLYNIILGETYYDHTQNQINISEPNLCNLLNKCITEEIYYCNFDFSCKNSISNSNFKKLFNIVFIPANRPLDDIESDKNHGLTSQMIEILKQSESWKSTNKEVIDKLANDLDGVKGLFDEVASNKIKPHLSDFSRTKGNEDLKVSLHLSADEDSLEKFISNIMKAEYDCDGVVLAESSQGLGYSNLIYIHLFLEKFYKTKDLQKINLIILEEPESHMHPQMQRSFIKYLINKQIEEQTCALVSTHSNEIVRTGNINRIRVIRKYESLSSVIEIAEVLKKATNDEEKEINSFLEFFFDIGYSDLIFADKAILYEGDTERFFIQTIINKVEDYSSLGKDYISYIQVGGAFASNYKKLLDFLKLKAVIITDIDYNKEAIEKKDILKSNTTNPTIKKFYKISHKEVPTVDDLYNWKKENGTVLNDYIYLAFQTDDDEYVRTLEEAILCKIFKISPWTKIKRSKWIQLKDESKYHFVIPNNKNDEVDSEFTIRDILYSLSSSKVDFMYSLIRSGKISEVIPNYIMEGLDWLQKK